QSCCGVQRSRGRVATPGAALAPPPVFPLFRDTAPPEIYTLSLHDALPISRAAHAPQQARQGEGDGKDRAADDDFDGQERRERDGDRKSTRLNSSHVKSSYAVFCLKKKTIGRAGEAITLGSADVRIGWQDRV